MTGNKEAVKPYASIPMSNGIKIVFWVNEREGSRGKYKQLSPSISKSWQDKEKKWQKQTINLNMNDLYRFFSVEAKVKEIEDQFKQERKNEEPADPEIDR